MKPPKTAALLLLLTFLLIHPPAAEAGTYKVYSCKTPTGRWVGAEGWTAEVPAPTQDRDSGAARRCPDDNPRIEIRYGDSQTPVESGAQVSLGFSPTAGTEIVSASIEREFSVDWPVVVGLYGRPYVYRAWHENDDDDQTLELRVPPYGSRQSNQQSNTRLDATEVGTDRLRFSVGCWTLAGTDLCGPARPNLTISRATFDMRDETAPTITSGCCSARWRGVVGVGFSAADVGGGVYRSIVEVDGVELPRQVVDVDEGRCEDVEPGSGDAYEFAAPRPCPTAVDGAMEFDSTTLRDGSHTLRLSVEDAAGNRSAVLERTVESHNAPISLDPPLVGGSARVGGPLWTDAGAWDGSPEGFDYRWLRCDPAGANCQLIVGSGGAEYAPTAADAYHRLVAEVVAVNASGSAMARSAPTALIADADGRTQPDGTPPPPADRPGDDRPTGDDDAPGRAAGAGAGGGVGTNGDRGGGVAGIPDLRNPLHDKGRTPNGKGASAKARVTLVLRRPGGGSARRVRSAASRRWTIAGRLTDGSGRAIAGARLNFLTRISGRRWSARGGLVRTGADGRFSRRLPAGASRSVRVTYFPFGDSDAFRASNEVAIDVLAPLTIATDRRQLAGTRRSVTISGRVGGGSIPAGGLLITLQGYQRGWGWRTFKTIRSGRDGRWRTSYRFRATRGSFAFRAIVPRQGRYPYVTTTSRSVPVIVG